MIKAQWEARGHHHHHTYPDFPNGVKGGKPHFGVEQFTVILIAIEGIGLETKFCFKETSKQLNKLKHIKQSIDTLIIQSPSKASHVKKKTSRLSVKLNKPVSHDQNTL